MGNVLYRVQIKADGVGVVTFFAIAEGLFDDFPLELIIGGQPVVTQFLRNQTFYQGFGEDLVA